MFAVENSLSDPSYLFGAGFIDVRVAETNKSTKIARDLGLSSRRAKGSIFVIRDFWRNAEDGPKDKQDCGFICFRGPNMDFHPTTP